MTARYFGVLRCEAKKDGRTCGGICGSTPLPPGAVVAFLRIADRLPEPELLDGNIWQSCRTCGKWNTWSIVGAVVAEPAQTR